MSADTDTGVLLIHGLGGTQYDLGAMHKILRRAGVETHALTLPGHGAAPEDLIGVRAESWLDAVTAKYREVAGRHDTLHVMGMCLGGLLAVELCKRENHRKGRLVSLAAPCSSTAGARPGTAACATWSTAFPGWPTACGSKRKNPMA